MTERNNREVGSCVIIDNKDRVLVLLRGSTDPWKPGWWDLPGGHLDGNETPIEGSYQRNRRRVWIDCQESTKGSSKTNGAHCKILFCYS